MSEDETYKQTVKVWREARIQHDDKPLTIIMGREWYQELLAHRSALDGNGLSAWDLELRHPLKFRGMEVVFADDAKAEPYCELKQKSPEQRDP